MIEMKLKLAEQIGQAALAEANAMKKPMGVSVVDESGRLMYFARSDGAGFFTFDTSQAKAAVAASFKRSTKEIADSKDANPLLWQSLSSVLLGQALPSPGGVPIFQDDRLIGAIGLGGGLPDEDHQCALVGAKVAEQN